MPTTNQLNNAPDGDGTPSIEFLSEFKVLTRLYSAEYGRTLGSVINVTTRSGTNVFHGVGWDYHRNSYQSANSWSSNRLGLPLSKRHSNSFGFLAEGPVYIPKVFNGKNRQFFMFTFQGVRNPGFDGATYTIPQAEQFGGDFSKLFDASGQLVRIYDPLTTVPEAKGDSVRQRFRTPKSQPTG